VRCVLWGKSGSGAGRCFCPVEDKARVVAWASNGWHFECEVGVGRPCRRHILCTIISCWTWCVGEVLLALCVTIIRWLYLRGVMCDRVDTLILLWR
jgi:hypothetical protein